MVQIFTAKLLNGDHVIGELIEETHSGISLDKALFIGLIGGSDGSAQLGFSPVSHLAQRNQKGHKVIIPHSAILCIVEFDDELVNMYKQAVGSIITAPSSFIMP
jgi:hypothetical protein